MINIFLSVVLFSFLGYGGYTDWKERIIKNWICVGILILGVLAMVLPPVCGIFFVPFHIRVIGIFPAALMLILAWTNGGIGGGDIKLVGALGFCIGYYNIVFIIIIASFIGLIWAKLKNQNSIPLGCFIFISYVIVLIIYWFIKIKLNYY